MIKRGSLAFDIISKSLLTWMMIGSCMNMSPSALAAETSYQALKNLIQEKNIVSVDELISVLPSEYRQHFLLVYKSRGLEESWTSFQTPRVVAFGEPRPYGKPLKQAHAVLSFSGNPSSLLVDHVEVMDYEAGEFRFHDIEFAKPGLKRPPVFHEDSPKCIRCHGSPARPLWDMQPLWPGVYGSLKGLAPSGSLEWSELNTFLSKQARQGRYSQLDMSRYTENAHLGSNLDSPIWSDRTTFELDNHLQDMNLVRLAKLLKQSPDFAKFQFLIYGSLRDNCLNNQSSESFDAWIPFSERIEWKLTLESLKRSTESLFLIYQKDLYARAAASQANGTFWSPPGPNGNSSFEAGQKDRNYGVAILRYLFENRGLTVNDWGMAAGYPLEGPWTYSDSIDDRLVGDLFADLLSNQGFRDVQYKSKVERCEYLKKKSIQAFAISR